MNFIKAFLKNNLSPELWNILKGLKKTPKYLLNKTVRIVSDVFLHIQFTRRKRKGFSSVPCMVPFMRLEFVNGGRVAACCGSYTKIKSVGNINKQTIEQIWNGKEIKRLRKLLLLGRISKVCEPDCQYLQISPIPVTDIRTDTEQGKILYEDICHGNVKLRSHPVRFNLANFDVCNLKCIMCYSRRHDGHNSAIPADVRKTHENIRNYFDKEITLMLAGDGDVLARKDTRELLQNFDSTKYNKVNFQLITNGLLFQPKVWETIKHNNFTYANISVDAATKQTYEKVRNGGNWEKLMKALDVFAAALKDGKFSSVTINMTIMRSNYREIPQFIQMARERGFHSFLKRIDGAYGNENIFELKDEDALRELKNILSDANLYGEDTDMNDLKKYIPREFWPHIGNHFTSIWYPSHVLKSRNN